MKIKRSGIFFTLIALVATVLVLLPTAILPAMAAGTTVEYANNHFNSLTTGVALTKDDANFFNTMPSTARAVQYATGNRAVQVKLMPGSTSASDITKEIINGGLNIDKNVQVSNSQMSYATADKVLLSVDYYLASGSKGWVQSQFLSYSYNGTAGNWFSLYTIDTASGNLRPRDGAWYGGALDVGAWNTVSIVVDMDTAQMDYYVNGAFLTSEENAGMSNLVFNANTWIIAKINKNGSGLASDYAGFFRVDNAKATTFLDSYLQYPAKNDANGNPFLGLEYTGPDGATRTVGLKGSETKAITVGSSSCTPSYYDLSAFDDLIAPVKGASIRLNYAAGVRFATQLNTDLLDELLAAKEAGIIKDVEIGTLITPKNYADAAEAITFDDLDAKLNAVTKYLNVKATIGQYYGKPQGVTLDDGYDTCFVGSVVNIKLGNRSRPFAATGYVKIITSSNATGYIYAYDYDASTIADYSRSIVGVAQSALADTTREWTAKELSILNGFVDGITPITLSSSSVIKEVQKTATEVYFRNAAGVYCRLSYGGYNGWRLQANGRSYDSFDDTGAAQALGLYLGESPKDTLENLTVTQDASTLKITAANHNTYVTINYTGSFNIKFWSASNVLTSNITNITVNPASSDQASDETIVIKGDLTSGEAIYGGGERFDVVNKRGTSFSLYTSDGWNSTATTYVAVPLFVTTRGAGIFMNRYERVVADFGKTSSNQWILTLDNDLMDCYFYATGAMSDALLGYTELSGHAGLPDEWAQGEMICRYSPDLSSFEDRADYCMNTSDYTELPDYETLYVKKKSSSTYTKVSAVSDSSLYDYTVFYENSSGRAKYHLDAESGLFRKVGPKGSPGGFGVKTIVTKLINAGMKPTAMILEPWGWGNVSSNPDAANNLKETVDWLDDLGIKTMLYMGVAGIGSSMKGYKSEYQVWANLKYEDGTTGRTYLLPRTSGTGENPDVGSSSTQQFLDITNPVAVDWYMNLIWEQLIEIGVDGIKIDFCETMPNEGWLHDNSTGKDFYLEYDWYDDSVFGDDEVHHAFSTYFISLFYKKMNELKADKALDDGFVVLSRGGGIGSQRNPYLWEGDQARTFAKIEDQLIALINTGISGIPFMTYDMAGYAYSSNSEYFKTTVEKESAIFARAIEYTAFTTNIQTHGDVRQAYEMTAETQEIYRQFCDLHEDLIPYIQKYSKVACETGMPVVRHLALQYQNDSNVYNLETQYMFGDALLVAPLFTDSASYKSVYLPAGNWLNMLTGEEISVGASGRTVSVYATLGQIPVFMNMDCSKSDYNLLAMAFGTQNWKDISGVDLGMTMIEPEGDSYYGDDVFDDALKG